jgi:1-deoxy-D-xylulose-5-phosphate reductoisomerase
MIETQDTSCIAQLGWADMRLPLVYSVSWPHRLKMPYRPLDLAELSTLTFSKPDMEKIPLYWTCICSWKSIAVLNTANEAANEMFRADIGLGFLDIPKLVEGAMEAHKADLKINDVVLDDILSCDAWAREYVESTAQSMRNGGKILSV